MAQKDKVTSYEAATMVEQISIDLIAPIAILEMLAEQDMTNKSSILYFVYGRRHGLKTAGILVHLEKQQRM